MKPFKRIYVEITNVCNLSCSFCPELKRNPRFMSVSEFTHIADMVLPYTDYIYLHVKGEPLLHPDLASILEVCENRNLKINITTNGTKIRNTRNILYHSPALRQVNISLHSFENITPEKFTELDYYLDTLIETSKYFNNNTKTITAFRLWNLDKISLTVHGESRNNYVLNKLDHSFHPTPSLLHSDPETIQRGIRLEKQIYLNFDYEFTWPDLSAPFIGETGYCYGLKTQLGILADGTVIPCCLDGSGIISLGNVFIESLSDILKKERTLRISDNFSNRKVVEALCQRCGYRKRF